MKLTIRQAVGNDARIISDIMAEAADWQKRSGHLTWTSETISEQTVAREIDLFFLAETDAGPSGSLKFQSEDELFWSDIAGDDAAYIHKVAVRRRFAGGQVSRLMFEWAAGRARLLGKKYLRLDCDAASPRLRKVYENFGFTHHSDKSMGSFIVARYQFTI